MHRQLGYAGGALAMIMLVSGYFTTIAMARRGFDLSGDLMREPGNPHMLMVFQLGDLLCFGVLVLAAILSRGRPDIHKRLMLLATIGGLMPAALTHIIGHSRILREMDPAIVLIPFFTFLFAGTINDRLSQGKIHAVSFWGALGVFLWANVRAIVIGPSAAWQDFAGWLIR
jgi:hypothetical protein